MTIYANDVEIYSGKKPLHFVKTLDNVEPIFKFACGYNQDMSYKYQEQTAQSVVFGLVAELKKRNVTGAETFEMGNGITYRIEK